RLYVDGQLRASGLYTYSDFDWQDRIYIGFSNDPPTQFFTGQIDDLRIWNTALSAAEAVQNAVVNARPPQEANLLAWYRFDESAGSQTIIDAAPLGGRTSGWLGANTLAGAEDPIRVPSGLAAPDCNTNGIPDTCELDSDGDGVI